MNAIETKDLTKVYKDFTLDRLNLALPQGCIMGLIGENGAGKSTTIKLLLNMIKRDGGEITLLGKDNLKDIHLRLQDIGVVPDEIGLPDIFSVRKIGKIMQNTFTGWDDRLFHDFLEKLGISENKKFRELSHGMKKKLGIAIALSHHPKLLILDEATNGLDPVARDEVTGMFSEFTRDESHAVLISSHIVSDLEKLCDYIAFMHKGRLILCEEKDVLRDSYRIVRGSIEDIDSISKENVIGVKKTPYSAEAIVRREAVPKGMEAGTVDIEQLFIFMVKDA